MVPKKTRVKICRVKKTNPNQLYSTLQKSALQRFRDSMAYVPKQKKRLPELNSTWFFGFFPNSQGLLHIVWAKCITSLKVWTITCLAGGSRGSPWMCGTFPPGKSRLLLELVWVIIILIEKTCASHVWDHLHKGTKS